MRFKNTGLKRLLAAAFTLIILMGASGCESEKKAPYRSVKKSSNSSSSSSAESSQWTLSSAESFSGTASGETSDDEKKPEYPEEWQDDGIFSEKYEQAYSMVKDMPLNKKIGQMLFVSCPNYHPADAARKYYLGGYVLFGRDFEKESKEIVISDNALCTYSQDIGMVLAVDEEGGTVTRISDKPFLSDHEFASPRELYKSGGMELIKKDAEEKAKLLKELGIDVNLAPVCDISTNSNDFMFDRSLGQNATITGEYVSEVTKISQENGVSVTLKHFPGYGNNADTHTGIAVDKRTLDKLQKADLVPFQSGIDAGAHIVMVSHNIVNCMDSSKPASLSENVHSYLRDKMKFTGLIVTDDLSMGAIRDYSGSYSPAVAAVLAGNDMVMIGYDMLDESVESIKAAVESGVIREEQIDHAVMRILAWKMIKNKI